MKKAITADIFVAPVFQAVLKIALPAIWQLCMTH